MGLHYVAQIVEKHQGKIQLTSVPDKATYIPRLPMKKPSVLLVEDDPNKSELLQIFCDNMNQTLDRSLVLKKLWGDDTAKNARSMDVFVARLRKYLKADTSIEIINIRGRGYKLFQTI